MPPPSFTFSRGVSCWLLLGAICWGSQVAHGQAVTKVPLDLNAPLSDAAVKVYFDAALKRDRSMVADARVTSSTPEGDARMLVAIREDDMATLKQVLDHAVEPRAFEPDRFGSCPVYWAIFFHQPEALRLLLEHLARGSSGPADETPLHLAQRKYPELTSILEQGMARNRSLLITHLNARRHAIRVDVPAFSAVPVSQLTSFLLKASAKAGYLERRVGVALRDVPATTRITTPAITDVSLWNALKSITETNGLTFALDEETITLYPPTKN